MSAGGVKANWHVDLGDAPGDDPFGERPRVERVGKPIELDNEERLQQRLSQTLDREGELDERGVTCALKSDSQVTCAACPLRHLDPLDTMTPLCDVGVEQESLITRLRILAHERRSEEASGA